MMFWKEIRWFIALYLVNFIVLGLLYFFLDGFNSKWGFWYFLLLSIFLLVIFLWLFYSSRRSLYQRLRNTGDSHRSFEENVAGAIDSVVEQEKAKTLAVERSYRDHLLFIDRWVHYVKTPLSVIRTITQEEDSSAMRQVQAESDRILDGVNMAMNYARATDFTSDFKIEPVELYPLFVELINELKHFFIRNSVYPELGIPTDKVIQSDAKWLKFIFYQLLTNAIKYSKPSGHISIFVKDSEGGLTICVKDTGVGISKEDIGRVFDIFFTGTNGRRFGESTGMGLYLVKTICDKLDYSVSVESVPGEGSVFFVQVN